MANPNIVLDKDGKPIFIGHEDPANPPVKAPSESSKMECPVCRGRFDYLIGEDTPDGGRMGCETCYRPGKPRPTNESYDKTREID